MSTMRRILLLFLATVPALPPAVRAADVRVELKNDAAMAVSVPLGADNGVTRESDFTAVAFDNVPVLLYPFDLYGSLFWSQPLAPEAFSRLIPGTPVRPVTLSKEEHAELRKKGQARKAELKALQEEARREAAREEAVELSGRKERLEARRDDLSDRIAEAEKALADEEGRADWVTTSEERGIDRALQNIQEYADRRDELQEQRNALSGQRPHPSSEIARITAEIKRLNDRIASERDTIRTARDRKRSARSAYLSRRQEWQKLVAERDRATNEIRTLDRKIRGLREK